MTDGDVQRALSTLRPIPEYAWLVDSEQPWYSVSEVSERTGIGEGGVRGWCERGLIPGAVLYGRQQGWRMPRSGLLLYFASLQRGGSGIQAG